MDSKQPYEDYRNCVQSYSGEKKKLEEDIHLGIALGTREFAQQIKVKFLPGQPDTEIPQQKIMKADYDTLTILNTASHMLD